MKAYPIISDFEDGGYSYHDMGMDLRDYFAAKAMQGFIQGLVVIEKNDNQKTSEITAMMAYKFADEMMEVRNATK